MARRRIDTSPRRNIISVCEARVGFRYVLDLQSLVSYTSILNERIIYLVGFAEDQDLFVQ